MTGWKSLLGLWKSRPLLEPDLLNIKSKVKNTRRSNPAALYTEWGISNWSLCLRRRLYHGIQIKHAIMRTCRTLTSHVEHALRAKKPITWSPINGEAATSSKCPISLYRHKVEFATHPVVAVVKHVTLSLVYETNMRICETDSATMASHFARLQWSRMP